jgi:hypothetical protein
MFTLDVFAFAVDDPLDRWIGETTTACTGAERGLLEKGAWHIAAE